MRPALPAPLARVSQLAYNVLWSWESTIRNLFRRMDPALWQASGHNPVSVLGRVPQATLERLYLLVGKYFDSEQKAGT